MRRLEGWLALSLLPCLLIELPNEHGSRLWSALWNFGHVVWFVLLTQWVLNWRLQRNATQPSPLGFVGLLILCMALLGGFIEILQWRIGRDGEWEDVLADTLGAAIAALFSRAWQQSCSSPTARRGGRIAGCILLILAARDVILQSADTLQRRWTFPLLYSPATFLATQARLELARLSVTTVALPAVTSAPLLRVTFLPGRYSTFTIDQMQADWRGYDVLIWRWYNAEPPLTLSCRAHDVHHSRHSFTYGDRYNQRFVIETGWNELRMPLEQLRRAPENREMDLRQMRAIACFTRDLQQSRTLYLERVALRRERQT